MWNVYIWKYAEVGMWPKIEGKPNAFWYLRLFCANQYYPKYFMPGMVGVRQEK